MKRAERYRSDLVILVISLVISSMIWLVHYLSQNYTAYLPFRIEVVSSIDGYATSAVSNETIVIGGQAGGFFILGRQSPQRENVVTVQVNKILFTDEGDGKFSLDAAALRNVLGDAFGGEMDITYIQDTRLTFNFAPESCRKVPVASLISVFCAPQYMTVSDIAFRPDSVLVYGRTSSIMGISKIETRPLSLKNVDHSINGIAELKTGKLRVEPQQVEYSVAVERFVEYEFSVKLSAVNVPNGESLILVPSRVNVKCRVPFGYKVETLREPGSFIVDYNEFVRSRSSKVVPALSEGIDGVLEYSTNPSYVQCILSTVR